MSAGAAQGDVSPKVAKELLEALDLRALRARRQAIERAGALQEAEARVAEARRALECMIADAVEARALAEAALQNASGVRMADILAAEQQEIAARREREGAERAVLDASRLEAAARQAADAAASDARAAETRVEKVRYALERELGAAERLEALRQEEAAANGEA